MSAFTTVVAAALFLAGCNARDEQTKGPIRTAPGPARVQQPEGLDAAAARSGLVPPPSLASLKFQTWANGFDRPLGLEFAEPTFDGIRVCKAEALKNLQ